MRKSIGITLVLIQMSCASYHLGTARRSLPGGYDRVSVPLFKNITLEPGLEPLFTTALIEEIERNQITRVVSQEESQVSLEGSITKVSYVKGSKRAISNGSELALEYRILIHTDVQLVRRSDGKILWTGGFDGERGYPAPQLETPGINSSDALYNQSVRLQNIRLLAQDLMVQAHSNMTENF